MGLQPEGPLRFGVSLLRPYAQILLDRTTLFGNDELSPRKWADQSRAKTLPLVGRGQCVEFPRFGGFGTALPEKTMAAPNSGAEQSINGRSMVKGATCDR